MNFQYVFPGRTILEELILRIGMAAGVYFPVLPVDEAIRVRIDQVENSVVAAPLHFVYAALRGHNMAALGNTHGQESNTE